MNNQEITILVDRGSTHSFIEQNLVARWGLLVIKRPSLQVVMANTQKINCPGKCLGLELEKQGIR